MALVLSSVRTFKSHRNHPIVSHTSAAAAANLVPLGIKTNCRLCNSISVASHPCFLTLIRVRQPITCARKTGGHGGSQPSRKLMLKLASMVALNLNILPQPLNSLIGEFAQRDGNGILFELQKVLRGGVLTGWRRKKQSSGKLSWFALVLICMGLMCWKISELDMFLRVSCFFLIGLYDSAVAKESIQGMGFRLSLWNCFTAL